MLIEFAGVSGSGKSMLMLMLRGMLRRRGLIVGRLRVPPELASADSDEAERSFIAAHPGVSEAFAIGNDAPASDVHAHMAETNRRAFAEIRTAHTLSQRAPEPARVSLVDEGFLHRLAYAAALQGGMANFADLVADAPKPDHLILVAIDQAVARDRIIARGPEETAYKRADRYQALAGAHDTAAALLREGAAIFKAQGVVVHIVDGARPTRRVAKGVANIIAPLPDAPTTQDNGP